MPPPSSLNVTFCLFLFSVFLITIPFAPKLAASFFNLSIILSDLLCQVILKEGSLNANSLDASTKAIVSYFSGKSKYSITSINSPGLIDPGYTGEIKVPLINHSDEVYNMKTNERFAQLVLINVNNVEFKIVKKLDESIRSDKGFGSTG